MWERPSGPMTVMTVVGSIWVESDGNDRLPYSYMVEVERKVFFLCNLIDGTTVGEQVKVVAPTSAAMQWQAYRVLVPSGRDLVALH